MIFNDYTGDMPMKITCGLVFFSIGVQLLFAQPLPLYQSFENTVADNWNFTTNPAAFNNGNDIWDRVDSEAYFSAAPHGSYFWEFDETDAIPGVAADLICHLTFATVDLTGQGACVLSFAYCNRGLDSGDYMSYTVAFDNTNTWESGNEVILPSHTGDPATWFTIQSAIPANAQFLRLRLSAKSNSNADCGGFDNIQLTEGESIQPGLTVESPADGAFFDNAVACVTISGTATNISGMIIWSNDLNKLSGILPATSTWSVAGVALAEGANSISITATNLTGLSATDTIEILRGLDFPQSELGSIAFTGFNTQTDSFSFVVLKELAAGTAIRLTDEEWNGIAFGTGEEDLVWSNDTVTSSGTVVEFYNCDGISTISNNIGCIVSGRIVLGQSGDGIIAYYGESEREPTAFLAAISSNSDNLNGTGLTYGETAVNIGKSPLSQYYSGPRGSAKEWRDYLPLINNASNWSGTTVSVAGSGDPTPFTRSRSGSVILVQ
jgi:hypothetical protein